LHRPGRRRRRAGGAIAGQRGGGDPAQALPHERAVVRRQGSAGGRVIRLAAVIEPPAAGRFGSWPLPRGLAPKGVAPVGRAASLPSPFAQQTAFGCATDCPVIACAAPTRRACQPPGTPPW